MWFIPSERQTKMNLEHWFFSLYIKYSCLHYCSVKYTSCNFNANQLNVRATKSTLYIFKWGHLVGLNIIYCTINLTWQMKIWHFKISWHLQFKDILQFHFQSLNTSEFCLFSCWFSTITLENTITMIHRLWAAL